MLKIMKLTIERERKQYIDQLSHKLMGNEKKASNYHKIIQ